MAVSRRPQYDRYECMKIDVEADGLATVVLNRPERLNAVDDSFHHELSTVWSELGADPEVRLIIVTGAGRAFCAGGDIKEMRDTPHPYCGGLGMDFTAFLATETRRITTTFLGLDQPVIAAVNGDAIGLGANLALMADISVVAESARIADTHVRAGLVAGDGGAIIWPLLLGPNRAKEHLIRGTIFSGREAADIGLVNHAVPAEDVMPLARSIAQEILALPQLAVRWTKLAVNRFVQDVCNQVSDVGVAFEMITNKSHDHREAVTAILERRPPVYTGE